MASYQENKTFKKILGNTSIFLNTFKNILGNTFLFRTHSKTFALQQKFSENISTYIQSLGNSLDFLNCHSRITWQLPFHHQASLQDGEMEVARLIWKGKLRIKNICVEIGISRDTFRKLWVYCINFRQKLSRMLYLFLQCKGEDYL